MTPTVRLPPALLRAASAATVAALAGCTVGPDYAPPDLSSRVGSAWTEPSDTADTRDLAVWWSAFHDPELSALVDRAMHGSLDLASARERVVAARARRGIENAARLPSLDATGEYRYAESDDEAVSFAGAPPGTATDVYSLGVVAGWELDLWGRVDRLVEAADAEIGVATEDYHAARVALAAEVAREVILIRTIDERLRVLEATIRNNGQSLDIARSRSRAGLAGELDLLRARRTLDTTLAEEPLLRADRRSAEHRVAALLGERAGTVAVSEAAMPAPPDMPALGLPADLLTRRPDIRRAERSLAAATARVGGAQGEKYPRISLSGTFALSATEPGTLFGGHAETLGVGPSITLPVLAGGRIRSNIERAESEARQAMLALEQQAIEAVAEVETALARRARASERVDRLEQAARSAADAESLASSLYRSGRTDFINVLDAQAQLLAVQDRLAVARQAQLSEAINLFTSLGGGWSAPAPAGTPTP